MLTVIVIIIFFFFTANNLSNLLYEASADFLLFASYNHRFIYSSAVSTFREPTGTPDVLIIGV